MIVRDAQPDDAPVLAAIYAYHVLSGTATFDTDPPSTDSWRAKILEIQSRNWPIIVVERNGDVAGYAYATQFRDRAAYAATCEDSIYVAPDALGSGIGTALLRNLVTHAARAGFEQMIAVIGGDEPASVALHSKLGFCHAGRMRNVGRKFGRLLDTTYMQLALPSEQRPAR